MVILIECQLKLIGDVRALYDGMNIHCRVAYPHTHFADQNCCWALLMFYVKLTSNNVTILRCHTRTTGFFAESQDRQTDTPEIEKYYHTRLD